MSDEPLFISLPAAVMRPAGIEVLPRAVAFTLNHTTIYLHPAELDDTGVFNVIGWHTDA